MKFFKKLKLKANIEDKQVPSSHNFQQNTIPCQNKRTTYRCPEAIEKILIVFPCRPPLAFSYCEKQVHSVTTLGNYGVG